MATKSEVNFIIVGGGLAGLSLASLIADLEVNVVVLEKGTYPRQKVCGEFISNESRPFLGRIGYFTPELETAEISRFELSFPNGQKHQCKLDPGGFGLSRWALDVGLRNLALSKGAAVAEKQNVISIEEREDYFEVTTSDGNKYTANHIIGSTGRYSNHLFHDQSSVKSTSSPSYFGVKYHIKTDFPEDLIQINLFPGGYAGLSKVEGDRYCFCYLAETNLLKKYGNISEFEKMHLSKNKELQTLLHNMEILDGPVTTSNFNFGYRSTAPNPYLTIGDSAGFIPPLTGNGMSLAFRSASHLGSLLREFFDGKIAWKEVEENHRKFGANYLQRRIRSGIFLQGLALNSSPLIQQILSSGMFIFPSLLKKLSHKAVGKTF